MLNELISVIMPVKNGAEFLDECLLSIQNQGDVDWELIVVDDHSSDNSVDIVKAWSEKEKRIRLVHNKAEGIPSALATGLHNSSGTYISRMDCDDIMAPDKLKLLYSAIQLSGDRSISVGLIKYFSQQDLGEGYKRYENWLNSLTLNENHFSEIYRECVVPSSAWMMRKSDIVSDELFANLEIPEDYDFCFRLYKNGYSIVSVKEVVHLWRDHINRTSRNDQRYNIRKFGIFKLKQFIRTDLKKGERIIIWGSGQKGKKMARFLMENKMTFGWLTMNEKKAGNLVDNHVVYHPDDMNWSQNDKIVVAVSRTDDQAVIGNYLTQKGYLAWRDYFFFF